MMKNYSDAFLLFESILNEDEEVNYEEIRNDADEFESNVKKQKLDTPESNNKKNKSKNKKDDKLNQDKAKEESDDEDSDEDEEVDTPDESPSTINLSDAADYNNLIDILNQFRAAHSFSNKDIEREMKAYFERLSSDEKKVLHVFIKGLIQVSMMDVKGSVAYIPSDMKFSITKKGSVSSEKKKSIKRKQDTKQGEERPIKIGESKQDKSKILNVIYSNR